MDKNRLITLIQNPAETNPADTQELTEMVRAFPFFQTAHLLLLYNLKKVNGDLFESQLRESAIFAGDRKVLFNFLHAIPETLPDKEQKPEVILENEAVETRLETNVETKLEENTIVTNVETEPQIEEKFGCQDDLLEFDDSTEQPNKDALNDNDEPTVTAVIYTDTENDKINTPQQSDLIEKFIEENPVFKPTKIEMEKHEDISQGSVIETDDLATETLALIYTDQKLFEKAILVYEKLILKFPEKSAYFATQIDELRKSIY